MSKNYILEATKEYSAEWIKQPTIFDPPQIFAQRSYQKWAIDEILREFRTSERNLSVDTIERFIRRMDSYACSNKRSSFIFSTARDTAVDLLDHIIERRT